MAGPDRAQTILYAGYIHPPGCGLNTHGGVYEYRSIDTVILAVKPGPKGASGVITLRDRSLAHRT
jgi:hypothetical protein